MKVWKEALSVWPAIGRLCSKLMHMDSFPPRHPERQRRDFQSPGKQFAGWAALLVCFTVALILLSGIPAQAQTNTASGGTTWAGATWSLGHIPTNTENVVINSGVNLTIGTAAVCASLTIGNATVSTTTLTVGTGGSLSVTTAGGGTGNLRINPNNVNRAMTLAVGAQSATIDGTVTLSTTNTQTISVSSGSISFTRAAGITWSTDNLTLSGAGTITFAGLLTQSGGTIANNTTAGTFDFQGGYTKTGGTFTTRAGETIKFGGNLTVSNTALTLNATSLAQFYGSSTVTPTTAITFGNIQIDSGVTVTLAGNITVAGNWTNNGGTLSGGTNTVTFSGAAKTIGGTGSTAFPDVTIASGSTRSLDTGTTSSCIDLVFAAATTNSSLTHTGNAALSVSGNVTINQPGTIGVTTAWNINAGTASVTGTTTISGTNTATTRYERIIVTSGTATFTGAVTISIVSSAAATAEIRVGTGSVTFSSAFTMNEGTLAFNGAGTMNFNGAYSFASGGSNTPVFTTVSGANVRFGGALTVSATGGLTLNAGSNTTFTGSGNITPTTNLTLGNATVNTGVTATTVSAGGNFSIAGNLVLSGTGTLAGTEPVLLTGSGTTLDGSGTLSAASTVSAAHTVLSTANLTISGIMTINTGITVTNNGTVTASDLGAGTGTWLQNAGTAWLNYSGAAITPTLTATAGGNTVVYNASGAQALKATNYYNLTLSNAGTKTFAAGTTGIAGNLSIGGTAAANATTNSTTIDYNGSGAQTVGAISYYNLTLSNAGTKTFAAGTTGIAGTFSFGGTAVANATTNSTTINYNGSGAQAVPAISYYHLTLSNAGTKTFAAGTTGIAGNLSFGGTAVADATTNSTTINYNGSGAQTVGAISYYNLSLSNAGTKIFAAGTTGIAGALSIGGTAAADATTNSTTINYNGSGAQTVPAISYYHLALSNAGTKTFAAGTTGIAGTLTISGSAVANATTNSTTINYNGSGAQTVNAISYYHLTLSNAGTKTFAAGTTGIAGNLTISGSAVANATTNSTTINYNGSGAQTVGAISYYHLTLSNAGTKTFAAGTTYIAGNLSISGTATGNGTTNSTTINYNGSGAQAVGAMSYYHLTLSNAGTKTFAASPITVQGDLTTSGTVTASCSSALTVNRNVSIGSGTTFTGGSGTLDFNGTLTVTSAAFTSTSGSLYVAGDLTFSSPTFNPNSGTVVLDGSDSIVTPGGATFNNLTVSKNSNYLAAGGDLTVSGAFNIQNSHVVMDPSYALSAGSVNISAASLLRNYGTGALTLGGSLTNDGVIELNGGGDESCGSGSKILIRSSVSGTQRAWSGSGTFIMIDVDVKDQAGTAAITCYGSQSSGNNGSNWDISSSCDGAPTAVRLISFSAADTEDGTRIEWQTGYEAGNIGFKVYRETASGLQPITPGLVAGSALFAGVRTPLTAGRTYVWWDRDKTAHSSAYWLEDIDIDGTKTRHGPVVAVPARLKAQRSQNSLMLAEVGRTSPPQIAANKFQASSKIRSSFKSQPSSAFPAAAQVSDNQARQTQLDIAAGPAVKLLVRQTGWYRVTGAQLLAAGISADADPGKLKLFADGIELAIMITGGTSGRLDPNDSIGFYGIGNDTSWSDARTYWLIEGQTPGKRITQTAPDITATIATGFTYTIENKPRSIYVPDLHNGDADNFFGPVITTDPTDDVFHVHDRDLASLADAELTVTLQGMMMTQHRVQLSLNNIDLGVLTFDNQEQGIFKVPVPQSVLIDGDNVLRLVALGGDDDISLIDTTCLTYQHAFTADADQQWLTLDAGISATLGGFTSSSIHVVDVGDPSDVHELIAQPIPAGSLFSVPIGVLSGSSTARLYAFTDNAVLTPAAITPNTPSRWNSESEGADVILLTPASFKSAALALKSQHETAGLSVALVDIEDIYDGFSFGDKRPAVIKEFVARTLSSWNRIPKWLVLMGDASIDPRNYLGFGDLDFMPSWMVDTRYLETASDDWFADINNDGIPELAVGRLPVRNPGEADALVGKLDAYRKQSRSDWMKGILLVADQDDAGAFKGASETIRTDIGSQWPTQTIYRDQLDVPSARTQLFAAISDGVGLVNYFGHGSVDLWHGNLLTGADAATLTNGSMLPVVLSMTCLNGFFADVYTESLAEALLNAANGGAAAVWASSGLTEIDEQATMNREIYRQLQRQGTSLGHAAAMAKRVVNDLDVRRTWILFGDPTLPSPLDEIGTLDTTPLAITSVSASSITETSAVITWSTDVASDSQVEYGISNSYGTSTSLDATPVMSHSQELTGLSAGTVYHYRVKSTDAEGNSAVSDDYTFTSEAPKDTTPPILSGITVNEISENTAIVTWVTDEPADTQVEFGETQLYSGNAIFNGELSTVHRVALTNLASETMYHFRVSSRDAAGNPATSGDNTFTTSSAPDTASPLISNIALNGITATSATVTWVTSEPADAQVGFGMTPLYENLTSLDPTLAFEHGQSITGLSPNTTYHFQVRSRDGSGNLSVSYDQTFTTLPLETVTPGTSSLIVSAGGATTSRTSGTNASTTVGYAKVAVNTGSAPYGIAVFSFKQDGVTITEVGVPSSPPTTAARIFVDYRSGVNAIPGRSSAGKIDINTAIAVVNYSSEIANVTYILRDIGGSFITSGTGTIAAGSHFATFINQLGDIASGFALPEDFQTTTQFASLEISSDQLLSILALRMTTNQRNVILYTTTPVADLTRALTTDPLYFAQFADGGGYMSSLILLNTSDDAETGVLQFFDNNGAPLVVNRVGGTADSSFHYSIPSHGVYLLRTDGFPTETKVGWVRSTPDEGTSTPVGFGLFAYNPADVLVSESGVPAAISTTHARVYVDLSGNHNTGLAIANPNSAAASITINAFQNDGVTGVGTSQGPLDMVANGHDAKFADEFISGLPEGFTGVLDISSTTPFAALTLRTLENENHDFLMTTFPVADANAAAPSPIVFPQVADGDGYTTQFIFISAGQAADTTLTYCVE
jgi:hypothetical protein